MVVSQCSIATQPSYDLTPLTSHADQENTASAMLRPTRQSQLTFSHSHDQLEREKGKYNLILNIEKVRLMLEASTTPHPCIALSSFQHTYLRQERSWVPMWQARLAVRKVRSILRKARLPLYKEGRYDRPTRSTRQARPSRLPVSGESSRARREDPDASTPGVIACEEGGHESS